MKAGAGVWHDGHPAGSDIYVEVPASVELDPETSPYNDDYFAQHEAPRNHTDITGDDGIVYRYFTGLCFEFHPLANFSALNAHATAKDVTATLDLALAASGLGVFSFKY